LLLILKMIQLEKLKTLHDSGDLSDGEFGRAKEHILEDTRFLSRFS